MSTNSLSDLIRDQQCIPALTLAGKAPVAPPDISYLASLWNSGPIGRAVALQIADAHAPRIETVKKALEDDK
jgi:hypothetical protein